MGWKESPFSPHVAIQGKGEGQGACQSAEERREKTPRLDNAPSSAPEAGEEWKSPARLARLRRRGVLARAPCYREAVSFNTQRSRQRPE